MRKAKLTYQHRTLSTSDEIAAYLHVTRMQMLHVLAKGPATISQIATRLGVHAANLTRHMRTLEQAGLTKLVEKCDTGRNLEKYYAATADSFDVAPDLEQFKAPHKIGLAMARSDLSAALAHLSDDDEGDVTTRLVSIKIKAEDIATFQQEILALAKRFEAADCKEGEPCHLLLSLYPGGHTAQMPKQRIELKRKRKK